MAKKHLYTLVLLVSVAVHVVLLQWTIEAYLGHEWTRVYTLTLIAAGTTLATAACTIGWYRAEYRAAPRHQEGSR
ncbi:hypothetical protein [Alkalicoccus urumqiensis]|uniref:Uncharacterized protein n=1 Tax=Alkalicoccus urumqiensis TaxID=1548213 RepID=A0A2P6MJ99_ALKUR|nr:hypothetical protein [Alkalicoccus urumqiensis]PRO66345.1 hypothetical protein C6I21_05955 [Alkalicoccus urumqiensis]